MSKELDTALARLDATNRTERLAQLGARVVELHAGQPKGLGPRTAEEWKSYHAKLWGHVIESMSSLGLLLPEVKP